MIKTLTIRNFLSHKLSKIKFSPGVNIIVGDTDSGKSAIVRALKWLIFNRPSGDSVRSHWGGTTSVKVVTDEGTVTRVKSAQENKYRVNKEQLQAVKTTVPEEVTNILRLNQYNLQNQIDSHFLISNTPADVAKHFNTIAHLNKIDIGLANTVKWVRNANASIKAEEEAIQRLDGQLVDYKDIDTIEAKMQHVERLNEEHKTKEKAYKKLKAIVAYYSLCERRIADYKDMKALEPKVKMIIADDKTATRLEKDLEKLSNIFYQLNKVKKQINSNKDILASEMFVNKCLKQFEQLTFLNGNRRALAFLISNIASIEREYNRESKELTKLEKQFHKHVGQTCPVCGTKLD